MVRDDPITLLDELQPASPLRRQLAYAADGALSFGRMRKSGAQIRSFQLP
jgi:hypothetical protein